MPDAPGRQGILGRFSREDCGLPPPDRHGGRPVRIAMRGIGLVVTLILCGWLAGNLTARWRESWVMSLPAQLAANPESATGLLARGRMYARALPARSTMRYGLSLAAAMEADRAPRRLGLYANAALLLRRGIDPATLSNPGLWFHFHLAASGIFAEINDFHQAFTALDRAGTAYEAMADTSAKRSARLLLINARAYYLAISGAGGSEARDLANLMISSREELPGGGYASDSAALLDTLATARFAAGDGAGAREAQSLALGLAGGAGLETYIAHYDLFRGGVGKE